MNPSNSPLLVAEDSIDCLNVLYEMSVKALEQAERIAESTDSLRAIAEAANLRKALRELVTDRQAWQSKQYLIQQGVWEEIFFDKTAYHISIITGQIPKQQETT